jgi:hypothetical protein
MNGLHSCMSLTVTRILRPLGSRADVVKVALVEMDRRVDREIVRAGSIGKRDRRLWVRLLAGTEVGDMGKRR